MGRPPECPTEGGGQCKAPAAALRNRQGIRMAPQPPGDTGQGWGTLGDTHGHKHGGSPELPDGSKDAGGFQHAGLPFLESCTVTFQLREAASGAALPSPKPLESSALISRHGGLCSSAVSMRRCRREARQSLQFSAASRCSSRSSVLPGSAGVPRRKLCCTFSCWIKD